MLIAPAKKRRQAQRVQTVELPVPADRWSWHDETFRSSWCAAVIHDPVVAEYVEAHRAWVNGGTRDEPPEAGRSRKKRRQLARDAAEKRLIELGMPEFSIFPYLWRIHAIAGL